MQDRRPAAGQTKDEDRALDFDLGNFRVRHSVSDNRRQPRQIIPKLGQSPLVPFGG